MSAFSAVLKRELRAYFASPLAYVFLGVYLLLSGLATWNVARFFDTARVELTPFFQFQPWLLAVLAPAIGMRLWSEDLKSGTADLYLTAPAPLTTIHLAKFTAGLCVLALALVASFPYWAIVSWLGSPDHGVIALSYFHQICLSAVFLMATMAVSAATRQQVVALVLSVLICLALLIIELNLVTAGMGQFLPDILAEGLRLFGVASLQTNALRGLFEISDLLVYLGLIALFAAVGVSALHARRRMGSPNKDNHWVAGTLVLLVLAFPFGRYLTEQIASPLKVDVTGYRLNTLSDGAIDLVRGLNEPIELTLYYSEEIGSDYPNIRAHADRVESLLTALEDAANGNIRIRMINPAPFSSGEDSAIISGITPIPTEGLDPLYFGLTGRNLVDDQASIAFLAPEQDDRLEFEIASLISRLNRSAVPRIGILSGLPALSANSSPISGVQSAISEQYAIDWISPEDVSLPANMSALVIAQPPEMSEHLLYLIERYLGAGGRVLILTDPQPILYDRTQYASQLSGLAAAWGIELSEDILADEQLALPVAIQTSQGIQTQRQPLFIGPGPAQMNRADFLMAGLQKPIHFGASGWLTPKGTPSLITEPLVVAGDGAARVSVDDFRASEQTPSAVRTLLSSIGEPVPLALRLSGRIPLSFETPPDVKLPDDPVLRRLAERQWTEAISAPVRTAPAEIVWIHDTDFLFDAFYLNPQTSEALADNQTLVLSVLDQFGGNPSLARLRARPPAIRPMTRVINMRKAAETEYLDQLTRMEDELAALETELDGASPEAQPQLRAEYLDARKNLRDLQGQFRARITVLENWLRWLTIWLPAGLAFLISALIRPLTRRRA